ncbi:BspA family leucine-rich repeat surface protein [bacterium]|nr:BspA family leucine-rich repeat surface protein [bacterium]
MRKLITSRRRKVMMRYSNVVYVPFIITIDTSLVSTGSSAIKEFKLPIIDGSEIDVEVNWGDGVINNITSTNDPNIKHTYDTDDRYIVSITGKMTGWQFNNDFDRLKITYINAWGSFEFGNDAAFYGCENLNFNSASGIPKINTITLYNTFRQCLSLESFNGAGWNVSGVENFGLMFAMVGVTNTQMLTWSAPTWNMSSATDMFGMFYNITECTNYDLANWDVSNVENMSLLWYNNNSLVNLDIDGWVTSSVTNINSLFYSSQNFSTIQWSNFDTSKLTTMGTTFFGCRNLSDSLLQDVELWDVSNVTSMSGFFRETDFVKFDMSNWDVSSVRFASFFFQDATISNFTPGTLEWTDCSFLNNFFWGCNGIVNLDLSTWTFSENLVNLESTFREMDNLETLNVTGWNTSKVRSTFTHTYASRKLVNLIGFNTWDLTALENASWMFAERPVGNLVDMDLSNWRLDSLITAELIFKNNRALRSVDVTGWGMSNVTSMKSMFDTADYLQNVVGLDTWDTSSNQNMDFTFGNNKQNSGIKIANWDVGNVTNMRRALYDADQFNENLENWNIVNVSNFSDFMQVATGLSIENYDKLLNGWENTLNAAYPLGVGYPHNITINFNNRQYTSWSSDARQRLIDNFGWTILDGGITANAGLILEIQTDASGGVSNNDQFIIPTFLGEQYDFEIETSDGQTISNNQGDATITFPTIGVYKIKISGTFPRIYFNNVGDGDKLLSILNWGAIQWSSFEKAFSGCIRLDYVDSVSVPDLTNVESLNNCFSICNILGQTQGTMDWTGWDISNVLTFGSSFLSRYNTSVNDDFTGWSFRVGANLSGALTNTRRNQAILTNWNLSNVTSIQGIFFGYNVARELIGLETWNTSTITNMRDSFFRGNMVSFGSLANWDLSNVTTFRGMFFGYNVTLTDADSINSINNLDVSNATDLSNMFAYGNNVLPIVDLSNWNVSNATNMGSMFSNCTTIFPVDNLSTWDITGVTIFTNFMFNSNCLSVSQYDALLIGWQQTLETAFPSGVGYTPNISITFGGAQFTIGGAGETAKNLLTTNFGWTIVDGGGI